jgi:D-alanine transaminase
MPRYAYVNGRFTHHGDATVHIEDRGYQFADGVYEVIPVHQGKLVDEGLHMERLERSLNELRIAMPASRRGLHLVAEELMRRNALTNGFIYMQITRGVAPRDHKFPKKPTKPALTMTTRQLPQAKGTYEGAGFSVISVPDIRWKRCDIKSQKAAEAGCEEAWQVDESGFVTEGSATNAWIVTKDNKVVTRQSDTGILGGITRISLLKVMREEGFELEIRPFSLEEAYEAREAFLTSSTNYVTPIVRIDGKSVGNGHPGMLTTKLRKAYVDHVVHREAGAERFQVEAP